ncbi:MAG: Na+/H+ antiporter NhaA [Bdellovibrionales bacterium]|nr:Na+/H+ antiporter NhaA [Bdellovibrionales bacterium]
MSIKSLNDFLKLEAAAGIILFLAAILALILENSSASHIYELLLSTEMEFRIGSFSLSKPLTLWINDGLMAIFFFLIGLEIKREMLDGDLSSITQITLPLFSAILGIAFPAIIYAYFNWQSDLYRGGWAIPSATDIAFALGVLSLFGKRVPVALKLFLTAVAVFDDIAAVIIIAIFYTSKLSFFSLAFGAVILALLILLNRSKVVSIAPYVVLGIILWICVLKSGVHATLAGVLLAMAIPFKIKDVSHSPLEKIEHELHPWVAFLILPIFAFANAGVSLTDTSIQAILHPVPLGIFLGLFFGKQIGVFLGALAPIKLGFAKLPENVSWKMLYGCAVLSGIGFTMSLFIATLAFEDLASLQYAKLGIIAGSFLSGIVGYFLIRSSLKT